MHSVYDAIYDPSQHFGRSIPILQSNGTGKSCLVEELGNKVHHSAPVIMDRLTSML